MNASFTVMLHSGEEEQKLWGGEGRGRGQEGGRGREWRSKELKCAGAKGAEEKENGHEGKEGRRGRGPGVSQRTAQRAAEGRI